MARLKYPQSNDDPPEASRPALKAVSQQLGFTPNSFKLMSLSPSALSGVVALQSALGRTVDARTRDIVARRCRRPTAAATAYPPTATPPLSSITPPQRKSR